MKLTRDQLICETCTARKRLDLARLPWLLKHRHGGHVTITPPRIIAMALAQFMRKRRKGGQP